MLKIFSTMMLLVVASISAYTQSDPLLRADVPFAFTVHETTLPAGHYQLTYDSTSHILWIRGLDRTSGGVLVTAAPTIESNASNQPARLTFHCYGKTCYLAQAWRGSSITNRGLEVPQTEYERRLALATRLIAVTIPAR